MFAVACVKDFGTVNISVDSCSTKHSGSKVRSWVTPAGLRHLSWGNLEVTTFCPTTSASYLRNTSCKISGAPPPLLLVLQALCGMVAAWGSPGWQQHRGAQTAKVPRGHRWSRSHWCTHHPWKPTLCLKETGRPAQEGFLETVLCVCPCKFTMGAPFCWGWVISANGLVLTLPWPLLGACKDCQVLRQNYNVHQVCKAKRGLKGVIPLYLFFFFEGMPGIFVTTVADKAFSGHVASRQHRRLMFGIC